MKQTVIPLLLVLLALTPAVAVEPLKLSIAARTPAAVVSHSSGLGGPEARANGRVTEASARQQCSGFIIDNEAELESCAMAWVRQFPEVLVANANCHAGILRPVGGGSYKYAGEWSEREEPGVTHLSRWRGGDGEVVTMTTAAGGASLAQQWSTLCGLNAKPSGEAVRPSYVAMSRRNFGERAPPESGSQSSWDHNGSEVLVDPGTGVISYYVPKPSIRSVVAEGTVLFRGSLLADRHVRGTAYAFKEGCPPAAYPVTGAYSRDGGGLVLRGPGPIRNGCEVVGYSERSPHAALRFVSQMSP